MRPSQPQRLAASVPMPNYEEHGATTGPLLVGVIVQGREIGTLEILKRQSGYALPLESLAELIGIRIRPVIDHTLQLETPLGLVVLLPEDRIEVNDITYVLDTVIEANLATPVSFNQAQFALILDLPWRKSRKRAAKPDAPVPEPDFRPPNLTLSSVRTNTSLVYNGDTTHAAIETILSGRLADGFWRLDYLDDLEKRRELRHYSWWRADGQRRMLAGHQQVRLHPLLNSLELTGLQGAWTNRPLDLFPTSTAPNALLSRRIHPLTTLRGVGPAAGLAELRVDDRVVARRAIGLDGRYEFREIALPPSRLSRIEVLVYDRHNLEVPVDIHDKTRSISNLLLPARTITHMGGVGVAGNPLSSQGSSDRGVGFYQGRYGLTDIISLEAAAQKNEDGYQVMAGLVSRVLDHTLVSFGIGHSEKGLGTQFNLESLWGPWRLLGRSTWVEDGFRKADAEAAQRHDIEFGYHQRWIDLSLLGHYRDDTQGRKSFLLPAVAWRPTPNLSLRARPDSDGDYRFDLRYRFAPSGQLSVHHKDRTALNLIYRLGPAYYLSLDSIFDEDTPIRHSALLHGTTPEPWYLNWRVGAVVNETKPGYLLGLSATIFPGVRASLEIDHTPGQDNAFQLFAGLTADLALSGRRILPSRRFDIRQDRGGIGGRIDIQAPSSFPDYDLKGIDIRLNGRHVTTTKRNGTFFIGALKPGRYQVELDTENLPIELHPLRAIVIAEVATAAVTQVNFAVQPEFSAAGRVVDAQGRKLPNIRLDVVDDGGRHVRSVQTDQFGLYRVDRLPLGRYRLRPSHSQAAATQLGTSETRSAQPERVPERIIDIRGEFLFDQDLVLPTTRERPQPLNRTPTAILEQL